MATFDRAVTRGDPRRELILDVLEAGMAAVDPAAAVSAHLRRRNGDVEADGMGVDLDRIREVRLIAIGKAAGAMAAAAVPALAGPPLRGVVVTNHATPAPAGLELIVAGHPVPNEGSVMAGRRALELASAAGPDDLVVCLISGGGSALCEVPAPGLVLDDLEETARLLLRSGADIAQLNAVRKHTSGLKGGRLAAAAGAATLVTLALSDVIGNPLEVIASGPTVPDPTTFADALDVVARYHLESELPAAVLTHLRRGATGQIPDTPTEDHPRHAAIVVGDAALAAAATAAEAAQQGWPARVAGVALAGEAAGAAAACLEVAGPGITVWAGETTVTVSGDGSGGRNQEAALVAALALEGDEERLFAAAGTDGIDGVTDAAGGLVDGGTAMRARAAGRSPHADLAAHDSHPFLAAAGDVLWSGPTGTNVGDLWVVMAP